LLEDIGIVDRMCNGPNVFVILRRGAEQARLDELLGGAEDRSVLSVLDHKAGLDFVIKFAEKTFLQKERT